MDANEENEAFPWVEITGLVRKPEKATWLRKNFESEGHYNYIDLNFWSHFFRTQRKDLTRVAYLERIVDEQD